MGLCERRFRQGSGEIYQLSSMSTNRIQRALCTVVEEPDERRRSRASGLNKPKPQPSSSSSTHSSSIAVFCQCTAGTSHSRHAPLCLIAGAGTVRRTGPWQETGSIHWPLDRTLHSVVHMPPNCTKCAPFCRACATTQRQVNTRQSPAVQPPGFPPAPNRRTCKQTWTRYLGGICRCCVPTVCTIVRPVAPGGTFVPRYNQRQGDPSAPSSVPFSSVRALVTSPNTLANGRPISLPAGWGGGSNPSRHRLPARRVGGGWEGPGGPWEVTACLSAYDPRAHRSNRGIAISSKLPHIFRVDGILEPSTPPSHTKTSGWLYPAARETWATHWSQPSGCQPVIKD